MMADETRRRLAHAAEGHVVGVGEPAPDFTLRRTFDDSVTLTALNALGPVLLAFYVFDFGHV